jgi:hypothetical protein
MTLADWIALATVALPLIAKAISDWNANAVANHNALLARVTAMAGREAATIARTLAEAPANVSPKALESSLVANSAQAILTEMASSAAKIGAYTPQVSNIVQGELNKLVVPAPVAGK